MQGDQIFRIGHFDFRQFLWKSLTKVARILGPLFQRYSCAFNLTKNGTAYILELIGLFLKDILSPCLSRRNLWTRRRMHLCLQNDQIGLKIIVSLAPADMAMYIVVPPYIITKNILLVNNLVCQLGLNLLWTCLALQGKSSVFISVYLHSPSSF
jgi:hypothetical protein